MIPKAFQIFGQKITVEYHDKMLFKDDSLGLACYRENKICLQKSTKDYPIQKSKIEQVFYHELSHWIFHLLGEHDLQKNEKLVDLMGNVLHQYNITKEGNHGQINTSREAKNKAKSRKIKRKARNR